MTMPTPMIYEELRECPRVLEASRCTEYGTLPPQLLLDISGETRENLRREMLMTGLQNRYVLKKEDADDLVTEFNEWLEKYKKGEANLDIVTIADSMPTP